MFNSTATEKTPGRVKLAEMFNSTATEKT